MASPEEKAAEFMERANRRQKSWSLFGSVSSKFEEAAELYSQAANQYKLSKQCKKKKKANNLIILFYIKGQRASDAYQKAAECNIKASSKHEGATNYINAANCVRKDSPLGLIFNMTSFV